MIRRKDPPPQLIVICEREFPRLVSTLTLYCGDQDIAEEISQEALARLCRDWHKVRRMAHPEAWLHRVAINLTHSIFRRRAAERRAHEQVQLLSARVAPSQPDVELMRLVSSLPTRCRRALLLRYHLGYSIRETAEILGCPEGTVKSLVHKAVQTLRSDGAFIEGGVKSDAR